MKIQTFKGLFFPHNYCRRKKIKINEDPPSCNLHTYSLHHLEPIKSWVKILFNEQLLSVLFVLEKIFFKPKQTLCNKTCTGKRRYKRIRTYYNDVSCVYYCMRVKKIMSSIYEDERTYVPRNEEVKVEVH